MEQLLLHLLGDYVLQSHWMAQRKVECTSAAGLHALLYSLPFLLIGSSHAVIVIAVTHLLIDRFRLARHVTLAKNWLLRFGPTRSCFCRETGFPSDTPTWLSMFLLIVMDNTMHLAINFFALKYL